MAPAITIEDEYTTLVRNNDGIFVMPQTVQNNTAIYVEYEIYTISPANGEQYYASATKLLPLATGFAFEIARQYELQITINNP